MGGWDVFSGAGFCRSVYLEVRQNFEKLKKRTLYNSRSAGAITWGLDSALQEMMDDSLSLSSPSGQAEKQSQNFFYS